MGGAPGTLLDITNQLPSEGRHTAMSVLRSPSKSPTTGMSVGFSKLIEYVLAPLLGRTYQAASEDRQMATSCVQSPSKSTSPFAAADKQPLMRYGRLTPLALRPFAYACNMAIFTVRTTSSLLKARRAD